MIGRALGIGIICAPFISAILLALHRAGRALHHQCVDRLDQLLDPDGRAHRIAYPIFHPHQLAYAAWLWATDRLTRSSR